MSHARHRFEFLRRRPISRPGPRAVPGQRDQDDELADTVDGTYGPDVLEFVLAMEAYKKINNRRFPRWSEVYWIFRKLGYRKPCHRKRRKR